MEGPVHTAHQYLALYAESWGAVGVRCEDVSWDSDTGDLWLTIAGADTRCPAFIARDVHALWTRVSEVHPECRAVLLDRVPAGDDTVHP